MVMSAIVPSTEEFTVSFEHESDAGYTYTSDPMHFPAPISPLFQSIIKPAFEYGFTDAARSLHAPLAGALVTIQENFYFNALVPVVPADEREARELGELAEATMKQELPRMMERWQREHKPAVVARNNRLATMPIERTPLEHIPALLDEVLQITKQNWATHFRITAPMALGMQLFDELSADLIGGEEGDAHAILVGQPSESVKAGIGLSDLASAARAAGLDRLLLETAAEQVMAALPSAPMGEFYAAAIRDYLRDYGLRQDLFDLTTPTWQEDPTVAIMNIQSYLRSGHNSRGRHESMVAAADRALEAARAKIAVYPAPVRGQFEAMVEIARAAYFLQEEHNFYIDQQSLALTRLLFLRLGERLVKLGLIARADDIFMLTLTDLKALVSCVIDSEAICSAHLLVLEREASLARSVRLTPPRFVGAAPAGPPPAASPMDRAMMRFFGGPVEQGAESGQLKGNPGSRGVATGEALVARTLDEAKALRPGQVLVAITTMPAWTPLFGTAAALVTETGGPLSHAAIVAREYGIPAVVGAPGATGRISNGDLVTVDGATGIVTIARP